MVQIESCHVHTARWRELKTVGVALEIIIIPLPEFLSDYSQTVF